jgi:hypothetical protein
MKIRKDFFKDWQFLKKNGYSTLVHQEKGYELIVDSWSNFRDAYGARKSLLALCSYWERLELWFVYKQELKKTVRELLK